MSASLPPHSRPVPHPRRTTLRRRLAHAERAHGGGDDDTDSVLTGVGGTRPQDIIVADQRKRWHESVAAMRARGLDPPKDYYAAEAGEDEDGGAETDAAATLRDPTTLGPAAAAAAAAAATRAAAGAETEEERRDRIAMEKARTKVLRRMGLHRPNKPRGAHQVDNVARLRFDSRKGEAKTEAMAQFFENDEEMARAYRTVNKRHHLKRNAFTAFTEASAIYTRMMGSKK